jgi:GAF domain-containing protein
MNQLDTDLYKEVCQQLKGLLAGETDLIANLANTSALLFHHLDNVNWAGFYLLRENELVLGPFQGKPACVRIPMGKGVCGTAAAQRRSMVVDNVHEFEGHIACDIASKSEIVIPLVVGGELVGVLDIDSPIFNRFDSADKVGLEAAVQVLEMALEH